MISTRQLDWLRLTLAAILIVAIVVPWTSFQSHSHWMNVRWIPFANQPPRVLTVTERVLLVAEMAGNVLLYVPLGYAAIRLFSGRKTVAFAAGVALLTEWTQVYSHSRIPSTIDVVFNISGAWLGVRAGAMHERKRLVKP